MSVSEDELFDQNPGVMSGARVFRGTRVPVDALFENFAAGSPLDEIPENFPSSGRERAEAAIPLARRALRSKAA